MLTLAAPQLEVAEAVADVSGATAVALAGVIVAFNAQIAVLQTELSAHFECHPDAEIYRGLPGLGDVLGARVLAEFGDDPDRYQDAKSRKNYASTSPVTRASGKSTIVHARYARNSRIADALRQWAFCSLTSSPGARTYYRLLRARGKTNEQALRQLSTGWVGILHGCLTHRTAYDEAIAWSHWTNINQAEESSIAA